jgi:hypothetical protein
METTSAEKYYNITKIDIQQFFQDTVDFINEGYPSILSYYEGGDLPADSFKVLDDLLVRAESIDAAFFNFSDQMKTLDMWDLLDTFEDSWGQLLTINNTSKWMRSSRVGRYDGKFYLERALKDFENFEQVASSVGSNDPQNDWEEIAVSNFIIEEDYSPRSGGPIFKISLSSSANFGIQTVVDSLVGERILGKDVDKRFYFANNDLAIVEYKDAINQTIDTIMNTLKGDIPEFPEDGVSNEFIGTNVSAIQYPTLFRNLSTMFAKDDRFIEVNLLSLSRKDDYIIMKIKIKTINSDSYITNISV